VRYAHDCTVCGEHRNTASKRNDNKEEFEYWPRTRLANAQKNNKNQICGLCSQERYQPLRCRFHVHMAALRHAFLQTARKARRSQRLSEDTRNKLLLQVFRLKAGASGVDALLSSTSKPISNVPRWALQQYTGLNAFRGTGPRERRPYAFLLEIWTPRKESPRNLGPVREFPKELDELLHAAEDFDPIYAMIDLEPEVVAVPDPEVERDAPTPNLDKIRNHRFRYDWILMIVRLARQGRRLEKKRGKRGGRTGAARRAIRAVQRRHEEDEIEEHIRENHVLYQSIAGIPDRTPPKPPPPPEWIDVEVGGAGDCWKNVPCLRESFPEDKWEMTVEEFTDKELETRELRASLRWGEVWVDWCREEDGDYHIYRCVEKNRLGFLDWNTRERIVYPYGQLDPLCDFVDQADWKKTEKVDLEDSGIGLLEEFETLIGSANVAIDSAIANYGPELMKGEASKQLQTEILARPTTKFYLNPNEKRRVEKYLGFDIACQSVKCNSGDHKSLVVARDLARMDLLRNMHPDEDTMNTLHIGATMEDVRFWHSRTNHSFYIHGSETKDFVRTYPQLAQWIGHKVSKSNLPALKSELGESARRMRLDYADAAKVFNLIVNRPALVYEPVKAGRLHFADSLYDMSEPEFCSYFEKTGATEANASLFLPIPFYPQETDFSDEYTLSYHWDMPTPDELWDKIWPDILVLTTGLDSFNTIGLNDWTWSRWQDYGEKTLLQNLMGWLHETVITYAKTCSTRFVDFIEKLRHTNLPFEDTVGASMVFWKYKLIFQGWVEKIVDEFTRRYRKVAVTWKSGFQNGYMHLESSWKKWLTQRVFTNGRITIASEIVSRFGEMCNIRFWVADKPGEIISNPRPPEHLATMPMVDWQATTFSELDWQTGDFRPVWTSCRVQDFYEVYSWAMAEPRLSMDFSVIATAANRTRRGLSLVSNIKHAGLSVQDKELVNFALNVYLAVHRDLNDISTIVEGIDQITGKKFNATDLFQKCIGGMVMAATGLLVVPAYEILRWLLTKTPTLEFIKPPKELPAKREKVRPSQSPNFTRSVDLILPATGAKEINKCMVCGLLRDGSITGQTFHVSKCTHEAKEVDMGMSQTEAAVARLLIENSIDTHRAMVSPSVLDANRQFETFLSALQVSGSNFSTTFHYILGGPGTGKSFVARALMRHCMESGYSVGMYLPLSALKEDYDKVTMPDGQILNFDAETWFKMARFKSLDVLFVDEFTLADAVHFQAYVNYVMPKAVFLIGDENQQHKSPDISIHPGISESTYWNNIVNSCSKHELQRNFRFTGIGAEARVKWLNHHFGYNMYTTEVDENVEPEHVVEITTAAEYAGRANHAALELVFTHATCPVAFGKPSGPGHEQENHSVYSSQGRTVRTSAFAIFDRDANATQLHGATIVAMTRSKERPVIVAHDLQADVLTTFLEMFGLTPVAMVQALAKPWPPSSNTGAKALEYIDPLTRKLNTMVESMSHSPMDPVEEPKRKTIDLSLDVDQWVRAITADPEKVLDVFETCTYDVLPADLKPEYLTDVMIPLATADPNTIRYPNGDWGTIESKKLKVSRKDFLNFLVPRRNFILRTKGEDGDKKWHVYKDSVGRSQNLVIDVSKDHVQLYHATLPKVVVDVEGIKVEKELWQRAPDGRPWADYAEIDGKTAKYQNNGVIRKFTGSAFYGSYDEVIREPTIKRVANPEVPSEFQAFVACPKEVYIDNQKAVDKIFLKKVEHRTKLRLGKDCHRLAPFIDASAGIKQAHGINYPAAAGAILQPPMDFRRGFKLNFANTFFDRTKRGAITKKKARELVSVVPGAGNLFTGDANETLRSLQRVCGARPGKALSAEGAEYLFDAVDKAHKACHKNALLDELRMNGIVHQFWVDAKGRNYFARAMAERAKHSNILLKRVTNKVQYKPPKDGKISNRKTGQTITTTSSYWNLAFGGAMRLVNYVFKKSLQDDVFYDSYEDAGDFRVRMTNAIQKLPLGVKYGIVDGEEFDAGQTQGTLFAEMIHRRMSKISEKFIETYYKIREPGTFVYGGICSGQTRYEKGSGFPDTLLGNTTLEEIIGHNAIVGEGPRVLGVKGDDFFKAQYNLAPNWDFIHKIEKYTNLRLKIGISRQGGEFLGCTVSREGMFLSIPRIALKAIGNNFRDIVHFREYQTALRDKISDLRMDGLQETIIANAQAMNISVPTVETCLAIADSVSHLNEKQFKLLPKLKHHKPPLPRGDGRADVLTFNLF